MIPAIYVGNGTPSLRQLDMIEKEKQWEFTLGERTKVVNWLAHKIESGEKIIWMKEIDDRVTEMRGGR